LDFRGDPPSSNLPNVKLHRAVLDLIKVRIRVKIGDLRSEEFLP
jgi:hypothetical protein